MKILRNIIIFLSFSIAISCTTQNTVIKVMTLNIRYDNKWDSLNAWPHRSAMVASFTTAQQPDLLGMQEVLWHQYEFLDSALTGYGSVAVGRDDGIHGGEATPVFYRLDRFNAVKHWYFLVISDTGNTRIGGLGSRPDTHCNMGETDRQNNRRYNSVHEYPLRSYK